MSFPLSSAPENIPAKAGSTILCSYRNCSDRMVIVRARGNGNYFLERVVFPFEIMTFHCPRECEVEVITRTPTGLEQSEWIASTELMAGDEAEGSIKDWRPSQAMRSVSVRSSASTVCLSYP
ncbi:MAG: DUF1830 domain-containing protein [Cyanobacteriota bacterium]